MPPSFIESPFCTRSEYESYLRLPASAQPAALRAAERGAGTPAARSAADHLPEYVRRAIYGEQTDDERRKVLKSGELRWRDMRFRQLPQEGTTRGEFVERGMLDGDGDRAASLPFGSAERTAAMAAQAEQFGITQRD